MSVVGGGLLDLRLDLRDPTFSMSFFDPALSMIVVFSFSIRRSALGAAEHLKRDVLELDAEILGDRTPGSQDRDVLKHRLATIAKARRRPPRQPSGRRAAC